jgi:hypothetical protein
MGGRGWADLRLVTGDHHRTCTSRPYRSRSPNVWLVAIFASAALHLYRSLGWDELTESAEPSSVVVFATPVDHP